MQPVHGVADVLVVHDQLQLDLVLVDEPVNELGRGLRKAAGEVLGLVRAALPQQVRSHPRRAIVYRQLPLLPTARGGYRPRGQRRIATGLAEFLEHGHGQALIGRRQRGHEPSAASPGDDDVDIGGGGGVNGTATHEVTSSFPSVSAASSMRSMSRSLHGFACWTSPIPCPAGVSIYSSICWSAMR